VRSTATTIHASPGSPDTFLDPGRQPSQVEVTGANFDPGVGDADERPFQIFVSKSGRFQHGPCRSTIISFLNPIRAHFFFHFLFNKFDWSGDSHFKKKASINLKPYKVTVTLYF
jgi:hypothetical protein